METMRMRDGLASMAVKPRKRGNVGLRVSMLAEVEKEEVKNLPPIQEDRTPRLGEEDHILDIVFGDEKKMSPKKIGAMSPTKIGTLQPSGMASVKTSLASQKPIEGVDMSLLASQRIVAQKAVESLTLWKCVFEGGVGVRLTPSITAGRTSAVLKFNETVTISEVIPGNGTKYLKIHAGQDIGEGFLFSHMPNTGQKLIVCMGDLSDKDPFASDVDGHSMLPALNIAELRDFCKKYDDNNNGTLSKAELRLMLRDYCGVAPKRLNDVLESFWQWAIKHGSINANNEVIIETFVSDYVQLAKVKALNEMRAKLSEGALYY